MLDPFSLGSARKWSSEPLLKQENRAAARFPRALCRTRAGDPFLTMAVRQRSRTPRAEPKSLHRLAKPPLQAPTLIRIVRHPPVPREYLQFAGACASLAVYGALLGAVGGTPVQRELARRARRCVIRVVIDPRLHLGAHRAAAVAHPISCCRRSWTTASSSSPARCCSSSSSWCCGARGSPRTSASEPSVSSSSASGGTRRSSTTRPSSPRSKDNDLVALARTERVDAIVSGDRDLIDIGPIAGVDRRRRCQSSVMTTLPLAWPCSTYATASRVWSNGNVLSMTGRRWPAS
jgi:hypothetical protein